MTLENEFEFGLIAISCHLKDYRLCWSLNQAKSWRLERTDNLEFREDGAESMKSFSLYIYPDEENYAQIFVVSNRSEGGLLIPEAKQVDYFLLIKGHVEEEQVEDLLAEVKKLTGVLTAFRMDPNSLRSKRNLIF